MNRREIRNVLARLEAGPNGKVRLVMDDATEPDDAGNLQTRGLYTWIDFPAEEFANVEMSETRLADVGLALVTRLVALTGHQRKE